MTTPFTHCSQCGHQAVGPSKFCPNCGAAISEPAPGPAPAAAAATARASAAVPPPPSAAPTILCSQCGIEFSAGTKFCPACGTAVFAAPAPTGYPLPPPPDPRPLPPPVMPSTCGRCGQPMGPGMNRCPYCGTAVSVGQYPAAPRSPYAGFWIRVLADLIDTIVLVVVALLLFFLPVANIVISVLVTCLYGAITESSQHQASLGKRALGLKVTDLNGRRITFGQAFGRWLIKEVQFITVIGWLALLVVAFSEKKQGIHDLMVGTIVWRS